MDALKFQPMPIFHRPEILTITFLACAGPVLSSIYYDNNFFTRIPSEETVKYWTDKVDTYSFITDTFSCEHVFS